MVCFMFDGKTIWIRKAFLTFLCQVLKKTIQEKYSFIMAGSNFWILLDIQKYNEKMKSAKLDIVN